MSEAICPHQINNINLSVKDKSGKRHVLTLKIKKMPRDDSILYCCKDIPETEWKKTLNSEYDNQENMGYDNNNNLHVPYEAFEESEQRFKTFFDNAADGILLADKETRKFYTANRAICQMLGYSHKELTLLFGHDIHPQDSLPAVVKAFDNLTHNKLKMVREISVMRKNGDIFTQI